MNEQVRSIFESVCDLPPSVRGEVVERLCEADESVREEVLSLLRAHDEAAEGESRISMGGAVEGEGATVGPYRLLRQIGEGGFGAVFEAQQTSPIRRRVAIKIIKLGMDTRQVIARFEAERQALAMMDHPSIARVFDAGATETGRPYFVMELVKGEQITTYCDRQRLSTRDRLSLFIQLCSAIQHAHQKGVIHRDIKPTNVLVVDIDGEPVPKVIDFGIAKATNAELTEKTLYTESRQFLGTPEYMSPEQAEHGGLDVDTRSDIYSLGVLLYELLTGTTPLEPGRLRSAGWGEIQRLIREEEPPKPSTRLGTRGDIDRIAQQRSDQPEHLRTTLRGDLDWIVMKAMDKNRSRRYGSADELAEDVRRYLEHRPVLASPPSAWYRLRKVARRHRVGFVAGSLVAAAVVLGVAGTLGALVWALQGWSEARRMTEQADATSDFLVKLTGAPASDEMGTNVTMLEALRRYEATIDEEFAHDDAVRGRLHLAFGRMFTNLGQHRDSERHLRAAGRILGVERGERDRLSLQARAGLGLLRLAENKRDEAIAILEGVVRDRRTVLGEEHPDTLEAEADLARAIGSGGMREQLAEGERLLRETLARHERVLGTSDHRTLRTRELLADQLISQAAYDGAKLAEAEEMLKVLLEQRRRQLGPRHPDTLNSLNLLAMVAGYQRRTDDAERMFREVYDVRRELLGEGHPDTVDAMQSLASVMFEQAARLNAMAPFPELPSPPTTAFRDAQARGMLARSAELQRAVVNHLVRIVGPEATSVGRARQVLALHLLYSGREEEALRELEASLEICLATVGETHADTIHAKRILGTILIEAGSAGEGRSRAVELLEDVCEFDRRERSRLLADRLATLAHAYFKSGELADAVRTIEEALGTDPAQDMGSPEFSQQRRATWAAYLDLYRMRLADAKGG